jgi:hypothetical protein
MHGLKMVSTPPRNTNNTRIISIRPALGSLNYQPAASIKRNASTEGARNHGTPK